jgi:hypothetical protein
VGLLRVREHNTCTIMQIKVADASPEPFDLAALNAPFALKADGTSVFESGQKPMVVGQCEYNSAYGTDCPTNGPGNGTV